MNQQHLTNLLAQVQQQKVSIEEAINQLRDLPFTDLGEAKIDNHRELRSGYPEVIYCAGKTVKQVTEIIQFMLTKDTNILATRATEEMFAAVADWHPKIRYNPTARTISLQKQIITPSENYIAIVTAGTADIPVAEEAVETAQLFGHRVVRIVDVGVAGIHRLFDKLNLIRQAKVIIVIAGMEGALASVIGGLVDKPVIAVPTSVGYGANFGGLSALLGMLTSCANGVSVVNIDNGFGAAYIAGLINQL